MFLARKGGLTYVKRQGAVPWDYSSGDFTADAAWHEKNMSAIVPGNAKIVHLHVAMVASAAGATFGFKPKGFTSAAGYAMLNSQVAGVQNDTTIIVPIGADGIVEYYANATVGTRVCTVLGWFL